MMKTLFLVSMFIGSFLAAQEQDTGTIFEELSFEQIKARAKSSKKLIFIDCYTSWCGPCKKMLKETFPLKEVGEYMNSTFVCAKFDCEKGEGVDIRERFNISSYPTYLILNSDGKLINTTGGFHKAEEFLDILRKLSAEGVNLDTYGKRYTSGDRTKQFIKDYCEMLIGAKQYGTVVMILDDLLLKEGFDKFYWPLYATSCFNDYTSGVISYIVKEKAKVCSLVGEEAVNKRLSSSFSLHMSRIYCVPRIDPDETQKSIISIVRELNMPSGNELNYFIKCIDLRKLKEYELLISLYEDGISHLPTPRRYPLDRGLFMIEDFNPVQRERVLKYAQKMLATEPKESKYAPTYLNYK